MDCGRGWNVEPGTRRYGISPAAAEFQVDRVARARGMAPAALRQLIRAHTAGRTFGVLGEPRVNVLMLNLALDHPELAPTTQKTTFEDTIAVYRNRGFLPDAR